MPREIGIVEYRTGFKTGVEITLDGFRATGMRAPGAPLGLRLYLTLALEVGPGPLFRGHGRGARRRHIRELTGPPQSTGAKWTRRS